MQGSTRGGVEPDEFSVRVYERAEFERVHQFRRKSNRGEIDFIEMVRPA